LLAHYPKNRGRSLHRALNLGWVGVDLFFVLSGYLIGGQLLKSLVEGEQVEYGRFYYDVCYGHCRAITSFGCLFPDLAAPGWKYLVFLQNFANPKTLLLPGRCAWKSSSTLCFLVRLLAPPLRWLIWSIPAVLGLEFVIRAVTWFPTTPDLLPEPARTRGLHEVSVLPDDLQARWIALGVGIAALKWFRPVLWMNLMARGNQLLCASSLLLAASGSRALEALFVLVFKRRVYFAEFVLRIPHRFGLSRTSLLARVHVWGADQVAVLSYSVYLTHSLALELTGPFFDGFHSLPRCWQRWR